MRGASYSDCTARGTEKLVRARKESEVLTPKYSALVTQRYKPKRVQQAKKILDYMNDTKASSATMQDLAACQVTFFAHE